MRGVRPKASPVSISCEFAEIECNRLRTNQTQYVSVVRPKASPVSISREFAEMKCKILTFMLLVANLAYTK